MKTVFSARQYWGSVADAYAGPGTDGFEPVLHPGAPAWFNQTIDRLQEKAWTRGLRICNPPAGAQVLDIGCGTGRWLAKYSERALRPIGADATEGMLRLAAQRVVCPMVVSVAQNLPFRDSAFDLLSAITVIQHIPVDEQLNAMGELARVLRPGGYLMSLDLIRGQGPHIFPHRASEWTSKAAAVGLSLVAWYGQEYLLLDRAFVWIAHAFRGLGKQSSQPELPAIPEGAARSPQSATKKLYWLARRPLCGASAWLETLAQKVCPNEWATHGMFIYRKS